MKHFLVSFFILLSSLFITTQINAATYYIAPDKDLDGSSPNIVGNDSNPGTLSQPWKTFTRAWNDLFPGDVLILLDGIYTQGVWPNKRDGIAGSPITIKAQNDGKAIVDGENTRRPIVLRGAENGWNVGNYYIIEGLVAKNAGATWNADHTISDGGGTIAIYGNHNILRRVSAYNADTDDNSAVIGVLNISGVDNGGSYNLIEDCVGGGSGRKMIYTFKGEHNIFRRCFAAWQDWRGWDFDPGHWPWGENIETYNASNNLLENNIAYGMVASAGGFNIFSQSGSNAVNNTILGSITMYTGMNWNGTDIRHNSDGSVNKWSFTCPNTTTKVSCQAYFDEAQQRTRQGYLCPNGYIRNCNQVNSWNQFTGFRLGNPNAGQVTNNTFQDIFAFQNASLGFHVDIPQGSNGTNNFIRATIVNNGISDLVNSSMQDKNMADFSAFSSIQDSFIEDTSYQGSGARIQYKYENRVLTNQPLWPWPMEERIKEEFKVHLSMYHDETPELANNFSVTCAVTPKLYYYGALDTNPSVWGCSAFTPSATPTPNPNEPTITPTHTPGPTGPTPTPDPNALISNISVSSGKTYLFMESGLFADIEQYMDRDLIFTSVPTGVHGKPFLQTSNNDKTATDDSFLSFHLSRPATVYVAHDDRITTKPTWLSSFSDTGDNIVSGGGTFSLFSKSYNAGTVTLGGNGGTSGSSMYSVILVPSSSTGDSPGDTDSDGDVDIFDYNAVLSNFGTPTAATRNGGDLDGDDDVDIFDYNEVIGNFGR